jgi:hypothetical protein
MMRRTTAILVLAAGLVLAAAPSFAAPKQLPEREQERAQAKEAAPRICVFSVNGKRVEKPAPKADDKQARGKKKQDATAERVCSTAPAPAPTPHG